jgi:hypothetical protein
MTVKKETDIYHVIVRVKNNYIDNQYFIYKTN